jgi:dGTPase
MEALDELRQFMFDHVYLRAEAAAEQDKAVGVITELVKHYLEHPDEIPEEYARAPGELADRVADYIAGMTDRYALRTYERLFLPRGGML